MRPFVLAVLATVVVACNPTPDDGTGASPDASTASPDAGHGSGSSCMPTTCAAQGAQCGTIDDGCGHDLQCPQCDWGEDCNSNHVCVCTPYCGTRDCGDNGCGGSCGMCGSNETCNSG